MFKLCGMFIRNETRPFLVLNVKQNLNFLEITAQQGKGVLYKRRVNTSFAGRRTPSMQNNEKIGSFGWFLLLIPVTTFGLGCWQLKRKAWKENLIKEMETLTKIPPAELPEDLSNLKDMEYRVVKVKGTFLNDKALLMGPRSFIRPDGGESAAGLFSPHDSKSGYWVITPFKISGRDDVILINRGWIPRTNTKTWSPSAGQITNEVEMTCVVRKGEQRPQFTPEHKGGVFLYRDVEKMSALSGAQPIFLDATYDSSVPGGPIGGQTRITLRNEHLSYLITWYSLSLATGFLWYRIVLKRKPF